jgi:hypothetical protein
VWGMVSLMRNISYELLDKTGLTTGVLLKFEDVGINKDFYDFIKDRLDNFKLEINKNYSITTIDSEYDKSEKILLIKIILSIPDVHIHLDNNLEQIINDKTYKFASFYDRYLELFNSKNSDGG